LNWTFTLGCIIFLLASAVSAEQRDTKSAVTREVMFGGCHFRLKDPYNGTLEATQRSSPQLANYNAIISPKARHLLETWIQFSCQSPATPKTYLDRSGIRMTRQGWALDPSPDDVGPPEQHTTFYALRGKGWNGGGVTQDDINGEEQMRTRAFSFCIPHHQLALCGSAQSVAYLNWPHESVLPQVIQLLESIEFVDAQ
jgi:hypothetical protein